MFTWMTQPAGTTAATVAPILLGAAGTLTYAVWYHVINVSRPINAGVPNEGLLSAHFIDDGLKANEVNPGVPECGVGTPETMPEQLTPGGSLYYSPYGGDYIKYYHGFRNKQYNWVSAPSPATVTMNDSQWHRGDDCTAGDAVPDQTAVGGKFITTVAGWSSGRNGPIMLMSANSEWFGSQIEYMLL